MQPVLLVVLGMVVGIVIAAAAMVSMMRARMVTPLRSPRSFEETCAAVERVVPSIDGWGFPADPLDMHAKLSAKGFAPENLRRARSYFVCKPAFAQKVLQARPEMSAIMPCSWSVYELSDGTVFLAKMNIGMMARMFSGAVGATMGRVARDEDQFLAEILR